MGVSTEILMKAREVGLRVGEVPISVKYHADSSTLNPVIHGMEVVVSTIIHLSSKRPLVIFGIPGFMIVILSLVLWGFTLNMYSVTGYFSTPLAVVSMTATLIGLTLVTTSLIIWIMVNKKE